MMPVSQNQTSTNQIPKCSVPSERYDQSVAIRPQNQMPDRPTASASYDGRSVKAMMTKKFVTTAFPRTRPPHVIFTATSWHGVWDVGVHLAIIQQASLWLESGQKIALVFQVPVCTVPFFG